MGKTIYHGNTGRGAPFSGGGGGGAFPAGATESIQTKGADGLFAASGWKQNSFYPFYSSDGMYGFWDGLGFAIGNTDPEFGRLELVAQRARLCFDLNTFDVLPNYCYTEKPIEHGAATSPDQSALLSQALKVKVDQDDQVENYLGVKITVSGSITKQVVTLPGTGEKIIDLHGAVSGLSTMPLLLGLNAYACNTNSGFTGRFTAVKISAMGSGLLTKVNCYIFNEYGNKKIQMGVYDLAGTLIAQTALTTVPTLQNQTITLNLTQPVNITAGTQYWLGVMGDGLDIPTFQGFPVYSSSFPYGMQAINNYAVSSLPMTINAAGNFTATNIVVPISAFS